MAVRRGVGWAIMAVRRGVGWAGLGWAVSYSVGSGGATGCGLGQATFVMPENIVCCVTRIAVRGFIYSSIYIVCNRNCKFRNEKGHMNNNNNNNNNNVRTPSRQKHSN